MTNDCYTNSQYCYEVIYNEKCKVTDSCSIYNYESVQFYLIFSSNFDAQRLYGRLKSGKRTDQKIWTYSLPWKHTRCSYNLSNLFI